jgi:2-keto-4-pentenoate hydratase
LIGQLLHQNKKLCRSEQRDTDKMAESMTPTKSIADILAAAAKSGTTCHMQVGQLPADYQAAEEAQDGFLRALGLAGGHWKLGASNHGSRAGLGLDRPFSGLIPAVNMIASGDSRPITLFRQPGAECELAVVLGVDLPVKSGGYTRSQVLDAVARTIAAIEVPETRFAELAIHGGLALVADNGAAGYAVAGEGVEGVNGLDDLDRRGRLIVDGVVKGEGDVSQLVALPSDLLTDHVNRMGERGWRHRSGDVILLGALAPRVGLDGPARVVASVDGLGDAVLHFAAGH